MNLEKKEIVIGTRGSKLALTQSQWVAGELKKHYPEKEFILKEIRTKGDEILDVALSKIGDKGLFVKEIEKALLEGEVDLAVHSMKDLPTVISSGLTIGAVTCREDPRDALVSKNGLVLDELPQGAVVGTSSLRRRSQLLNLRPDFKIIDLRGNLDTRLRKLEEMEFDAIVIATAGIKRLGWEEKITQKLSLDISTPAVGQGALGIEIREGDPFMQSIVDCLNSQDSYWATKGERAFLRELEGGCQVPIGAFGELQGEELVLTGMVASVDGSKLLRKQIRGPLEQGEEMGKALAQEVLQLGAGEILAEVRGG